MKESLSVVRSVGAVIDGTPAPPRDPLSALPPRRPGSLRRTMHVDVGPRAGFSSSLVMTGAARDLRTGPAALGDATVLAEAAMSAQFDAGRNLMVLETTPAADWTGQLLGARAGGGFRRHLDAVVPAADAGSLLRQVLDDLPAAALISGYASMRAARRSGDDPSSLVPPGALGRMTDLCSGWRAGGTLARSVGAGRGVPVQDCPLAPGDDDDPWAWHAVDPLERDWMRRRRCLDVTTGKSGSFAVWAMFRDTVGDGDGAEAVLHEYAVTAAGSGTVLSSVAAEPRVLPFAECSEAAGAVTALVGAEVADLPVAVPDRLTGIGSCTHLNDLLRALGGLPDLVARVQEA